jgi:hypothetical protein
MGTEGELTCGRVDSGVSEEGVLSQTGPKLENYKKGFKDVELLCI